MKFRIFAMLAMLLAAVFSIAGCGGSGGSAATGTQIVSKGVITGFGSVFVNGVEFDIPVSANIILDDATASSDNLKTGMVVKVKGTLNNGGTTGSAASIEYEDSLEGPVSNLTANGFSILNQDVLTTTTTVYVGVTGLSGITNGQFVEVSGLMNPDGIITATRIETKSSTEYKIRGTVSNLGTNTFVLTVRPGLDYRVDFSSGTITILPSFADLKDGAFVKVSASAAPTGGTTIMATKVSVKRADIEDADRAEVEGFVSNYNSSAHTFSINNINVDAASIILPTGFTDGIRIEVEGKLANGLMTAVKLVREKDSNQEVQGAVTAKTGSTMTIGGTLVTVTSTTMYLDSSTANDRLIGFASIAINDLVDVKGYLDDAGNFIAVRIERK